MTDLRDLLYPENEGWNGGDNAVTRARASQQRSLPKRFYTAVTIEATDAGYLVLLDARKARTPAKNLLALPTHAAAEIVASEWMAQGQHIDPLNMHATRIANVGIDRVEAVRAEMIAEIARYAGTDTVCYRASTPERLVALEARHWDPVLAHVRDRHRALFSMSVGIGHQQQSEAALGSVVRAVESIRSPIGLAAFSTLVTIAGSTLIALCIADRVLDANAGFDAASVEEDWAAELWGADEEALARRTRRLAEFTAAARLLLAV